MKFRSFQFVILQTITFGSILFAGACGGGGAILSYSTGTGEREIDNRRRTGECAFYERCQEMCDEIFQLREDREKCEEYSILDVEKLEVVFKVLENFDGEAAKSLELKDVEFLLNISSDPLEKAMEQMSVSQREDFLIWLASDSETAGLVADAEKEFKILKKLLGIAENDILSSINNPLDREGTFIEIALKERNSTVLEWTHDFFGKNCEKNSSPEQCVFTRYYCHFSLSSDSQEEKFLDYPFFTKMLDKVLSDHPPENPPRWWIRGIRSQDLSSWQNYPHDVCAEDLY